MIRAKLSRDVRTSCIADHEHVYVLLHSGATKLAIEMPAGAATAVLKDMSAVLQLEPITLRPAPPRYKWADLVRRLDAGKGTPADALAARDLLHYLGVPL